MPNEANFYAFGILCLMAAPQKPMAITATAMMPNNTFFIDLSLPAVCVSFLNHFTL